MNRHSARRATLLLTALAALSALHFSAAAGVPPGDLEWPHYGADRFSSRHAATEAFTADNLGKLEEVWRYTADSFDKLVPGGKAKTRSIVCTPIMVGGRLYFTSSLQIVVCADAETGAVLWTFDPKSYEKPAGPHGGQRSRGVEYWTDGKEERIILATGGLQLFALNAATGEQIMDFGEEGGWTDLSKHLGVDYNRNAISMNAPAIVCRDTIVVGSVVNDFGQSKSMPPGHVRGFDVRTGKFKWIFHSIPKPGEFGYDTWENGSAEYTGNTNVWTMMSADEELGYVYLPFGTPTDDHYGGHRHGANLFAESLVCVKAETGERVWHFQGVHHGIWDYDFPCAPNLLDVTVNGKKVKAVAQASKQAFLYVFNRETGEPLWPIEERPVPPSRVPGEKAHPTQPFPTKPPAFDVQGITTDTLNNLTPEVFEEAKKLTATFEIGPVYTPPIAAGQDGKQGLIQMPGMTGGANWPGAAVDPETGRLYINSYSRPNVMALRQGGGGSDLAYNRGMGADPEPMGLPLTRPPWGRVTAYDLNAGDIAWQIPYGDSFRNHAVVKAMDPPPGPLGSSYSAGLAGPGVLTTKNLVIANQALPAGEGGGGIIWAYDKATGAILLQKKIPVQPVGPPMMYVHKGKPYLAFSAGAKGKDAAVVVFGLK